MTGDGWEAKAGEGAHPRYAGVMLETVARALMKHGPKDARKAKLSHINVKPPTRSSI